MVKKGINFLYSDKEYYYKYIGDKEYWKVIKNKLSDLAKLQIIIVHLNFIGLEDETSVIKEDNQKLIDIRNDMILKLLNDIKIPKLGENNEVWKIVKKKLSNSGEEYEEYDERSCYDGHVLNLIN